MEIAVSLTGAVVPSLLLVWYFYHHDQRPEPKLILLATFALGFLLIIPLLLLGWLLGRALAPLDDPILEGLRQAFLDAAIPEELLKFAVLMGFCARHRAFDEPMDGVVYGAVVALGFATLENVIYVLFGGWTVAVMRALTTVPFHAFLGAVLGYYVGLARFRGRSTWLVWRGLLVVILAHGLYDFPLLALRDLAERSASDPAQLPPLGLVILLFAVSLAMLLVSGIWTVRCVRRLYRLQKRDG